MAALAAAGGSEGTDQSKKKSIVIVNMPEEFIDREIIKRHFEQFGTVERLACSVSKKYAVVHFSSEEEAQNATVNGTKIKPDAPPLKIVNRAVDLPAAKKDSTQAEQPSSKIVTHRKIVRTFNPSGSGTATTAIVKDRGAPPPARHSPLGEMPTNTSKKWSPSHGPLRSGIKVSRPSPLRKKPTFGDKSGKAGPSGSKNPFSIPPRNMMSLDRRKKSSLKAVPGSSKKATPDFSEVKERIPPPVSSEPFVSENSAPVQQDTTNASSGLESPIENPVDPLGDVGECSNDQPGEGEGDTADNEPSLDIDETTEDAAFHDEDDDAALDRFGDEIDQMGYSPRGEVEVDQDTQDTAEVSTEEGEIHDDEEQDEDEDYEEEQNDENEDDDVYESPMKRAEQKETSGASSSGGFSFNLSSVKKEPSSSTGATPSMFKLPFTSPFALGDAPKPFSSSSFGINLNPGSMSKIFAGSSTSTAPVASAAAQGRAQTDEAHSSKEKQKSGIFSVFEKKTEPEKEKPKSQVFGLFSSFSSGSSATPKSSSFGTSSFSALASEPAATSSVFKQVPASIPGPSKSATESKPSSSLFSVFKNIPTSSSTSRSNSPSLPVESKPPTLFSGFKSVSNSTNSSSSSTKRNITPSITASVPSSSLAEKERPNPLLLTFTPDTSEAQELFTKRSNTVEERYRILEARDKLIRARIPKTKVNVEHAKKLIGTCPDMCPEKERYMRQFQRQLVAYEMLPGQDHVVDHLKAIKAYSRSSADQEEPLPHELRPGPTLDYTMHYLLHYIVPLGDNPDENLSDWYNFLWDRTRSIRKDITQQQIIDLTAVSLYEKCARFHIHCASRLCELDVHSFDPKLNDENLMKCLQSLEHLYEDLRRRQVKCPNEPEFRAYQIMMNLNEGDALYNAQQLPEWILNSEVVKIALKLHHSIYTKNFVAFFRTVATLPYMMSCILHRYFFQVRSIALRCFIKAHCTLPKYETAMPLSTLQRMFGYGSAVQSFSYLCESHGIHCDIEDNKVILKRKMFFLPESPSMYREEYLIDSKLNTSVAEAINGGPLPDIDYANRKIHSSFNESGQLISGSIIGSEDNTTDEFVPPEPIVSSRSFSKSTFQTPSVQSGFSFGLKKKEPVQPPKPFRQIEAVSQIATSNLIEEVVKSDITRLSEARLEEAKLIQQREAKRKLREEIVNKLANEFVEQTITQQVSNLLRLQAISGIRQVCIINEITETTVTNIIDDGVIVNLGISARTELILAKEYHHRLLRNLQRIFTRLRVRFALERWIRFTKNKIMEREREEEKRREELWNFPVINPYQSTTKDVYRAFCGNSPVQPSLTKVSALTSSSEKVFAQTRLKRKSDGDNSAAETSVMKIPRIDTEYNEESLKRSQGMWDFPSIDSYSRTNRQVLDAFCGPSDSSSMNLSLNTSFAGKRKLSSRSSSPSSEFKIHKPLHKLEFGRGVCKEIREKSNEVQTDLLLSIRSMINQIKEEKEQTKVLDAYVESVEEMNRNYPDLDVSVGSIQNDENQSDDETYNDEAVEWRNASMSHDFRSNIFSGVFTEENNLLRSIKSLTRQIKAESAKWRTDTFLNDLDVSTLDN